MGRPRGVFRALVVGELSRGPGTVRELALRTGLSLGAARVTLDNMERAGEATVVDTVRQSMKTRSVPVYALAVKSDAEPAAVVLDAAMRGWLHSCPDGSPDDLEAGARQRLAGRDIEVHDGDD